MTIANPSATTLAIHELEALAKNYAQARALVKERVTDCNEEVRAIYRRRLAGIQSAVADAKDAQAKLSAAVQANTNLFVQPRTMTLHGIRFGLGKGAGRITWDCEDETLVARIEKFFADDPAAIELLVISSKSPSKDALKNLDAKALAKLGVEVEGTGDVVIIKASDSEVDKLTKRVLKEGAIEKAEDSVQS